MLHRHSEQDLADCHHERSMGAILKRRFAEAQKHIDEAIRADPIRPLFYHLKSGLFNLCGTVLKRQILSCLLREEKFADAAKEYSYAVRAVQQNRTGSEDDECPE